MLGKLDSFLWLGFNWATNQQRIRFLSGVGDTTSANLLPEQLIARDLFSLLVIAWATVWAVYNSPIICRKWVRWWRWGIAELKLHWAFKRICSNVKILNWFVFLKTKAAFTPMCWILVQLRVKWNRFALTLKFWHWVFTPKAMNACLVSLEPTKPTKGCG